MKPGLSESFSAASGEAHFDARLSLLKNLNEQLAAADALDLDLVAIRISEAIDQLVDHLGLHDHDGVAH